MAQPKKLITPIDELTDEEVDQGVAELSRRIGKRAHEAGWRRRLGKHSVTGAWYLSLRHPLRKLPSEYVDRPWLMAEHLILQPGMAFEVLFTPIAEAVRLLKKPDNPDAEMLRRERLLKAHEEELEAEKQRQRLEQARRAELQREDDRLFATFRGQEWNATPPLNQLCYLLALAVEEGKDLAVELRSLGHGGFLFPQRRWWAEPHGDES